MSKVGGFEFKFGNSKIRDNTLITNMGSAHNCPSANLHMCPIAGSQCYAYRDENTYPGALPFRVRQEAYWLSNPAEVFVDHIMSALAGREKYVARQKVKHFAKHGPAGWIPFKKVVRWNESGDFHGPACVEKLKTIAELTPGVTHYVYTHRTDLVQQLTTRPKNLVVQVSVSTEQDSAKYNALGFNTFFTDTTLSIKGKTKKLIEGMEAHAWAKAKLKEKYGSSALTCSWECNKCALCKVNHGKSIHICMH